MIADFLAELRNIDVEVSLIGALIAGALIGSEREVQGRAAGLRTHTLVCFTAALMTLLGLRMDEWLADLPEGAQIVSDMSRMPHGILTGVGFLGAGVIFRDGVNVQGLTTAATLWLTAALGIVFGTGLIGLATLSTLIALAVLIVLRVIQRSRILPDLVGLELTLPLASTLTEADLRGIMEGSNINIGPVTHEADKTEGYRRYVMQLRRDGGPIDLDALGGRLGELDPLGFKLTPAR